MKKFYIFIIISIFSFTLNLLAQPAYWNYNTTGTGNVFPFNVSAGKQVQWLIRAGEINQPGPVPPNNNITTIWFYMGGAGTATYSTLTVKLGQTTLTDLPAGVIYTGPMTTVYTSSPATLTFAASTWVSITLTTPFLYDPTQSLVIDVQQCGITSGTGASINQTTVSGTRRMYSTSAGCPQSFNGNDAYVCHFGVTVVPAGPCTNPPVPGTVTSNKNPVCSGTSFLLTLVGGTSGSGQTYQWQSSPDNSTWTDIPGATNSSYTGTQSSATYYRCAVTCGTTVISGSLLISMFSGTYTIDNTQPTGGTNFNSFTAAINALNSCGTPNSPIIFNVIAGQTFTEIPPPITATGTAVNTITFQKSGGGANPIVQSAVGGSGTISGSTGGWGDAFFRLVGSDYITFNGIDIKEQYTGATQTLRMEYGFQLVRASSTDGCKNISISNCFIQLYYQNMYSHCIGSINYNNAGSITNPSTIAGRHENIFINGNTLTNTIHGVYINGYAAPSPYDLYENNIQIGTTSANLIKHASYSTTSYGIYMIYADSVKIANNNFISGAFGATYTNTSTLWGMYLSTGTNSMVDIYNNTVRDSSMITGGMTSSQMTGIGVAMGSSGTNNTVNIYNNTVECKYGTATTGNLYGIYLQTSPFYLNVYNNNVTNNQHGSATTTGTCYFYGIYNTTGTSTVGTIYQFYGNNINNNTRLRSSMSSGNYYGIYISSSGMTLNIYANNINNNSWPNSGANYGIYKSTTTPNLINIYNNTISGNTMPAIGATASSATFYGIYQQYVGTSGTANIYSNSVNNNSSTGVSTMYGIYSYPSSGTRANLYNNSIYELNTTGTSGGSLYGMYLYYYGDQYVYNNIIRNLNTSTSTAWGIYTYYYVNAYIYNNFIQQLTTVSYGSTTTPGVCGIYASNNSGYYNYIYYNTIYLDDASSSSTFSSACVYASTSPYTELRNNILVNNSTPGASGRTVAYWRSTTTLTSYLNNSTANCLYAGTPGATRLLYYDGTNSDQLISAFKTRVYPRDQQSFSENPPFISLVSPYNLHLNTGTATLCNNQGISVTTPVNITTDYDYNTRSTSTPDVGADEFNGTSATDILPPYISYTPLTNGGTGGKTFSNCIITDMSGVNTTSGTRPRVYYKRTTDANTFVDNTSLTNGWKWVEATGTTSPFTFNIDYSIIFGGSVTIGDVIQYFVIAQDLAGTPNVGTNQVILASAPASVNLAAGNFPASGTINQYSIVTTWSGTINVGPSYTYTSLTNPGGIFASINANPTLSGNLTIVIKEDLLAETGANALNQWVEDGVGGYTVTITCDPGTPRTVSGSYNGGLIRLYGADRVIFDGVAVSDAPGGYLTFQNTSPNSSTAAIMLMSLGTGQGCRQVQIKNCNIKCGTNGTITYAIHVGGTSVGGSGADNDTCTIQNNAISMAYYGIWAYGTSSTSTGGNDNLLITQNRIGDNTATNSIGVYGIYSYYSVNGTISQNTIDNFVQTLTNYGMYIGYANGLNVYGNTVKNLSTSSSTVRGMYFYTGVVNSYIYKNNINNIRYTGTAGYGGWAMYFSTGNPASNIIIYNNIIYQIGGDGYTSFSGSSPVGMYFDGTTGGVSIYYNSIYMSGNLTYNAATLSTAILFNASNTNINLRDNVFQNSMNNTANSSAKNYAIYSYAPNTAFTNINYNDYWVTGSQGVLGNIGALDRPTITDWRTGTGQDLNSLNSDPQFNAVNVLQPLPGSPVYHAGTPIGGITDDYLGAPRHATTPTMGAYEETNDAAGPIITYTLLPNTSSTLNRSFTNVNITDISGVNTTSGTRPRCYYKKQSNANTWGGTNNSFTDGWKWVEANGTSNPFDFTIDYSKLYPTGSVSTGDTVQYFVIAQDLWTTPNVSINSGTPATQPSSVDLNATHFPMTGTINNYRILNALSGTINIGTAYIYQSLTNAGGFFEAVNSSVITGNITAYIWDDLNETGLNALNQWSEEGTGGYTITIRPGSASLKNITGSVATGMIRLNGCDRVIFDGNGGFDNDAGTKYLLFRNTNGTSATFYFINDARNNTIKDCYIESNNTSTTSGTIYFATTTGTSGNDSNTIDYCDIRDNTDITGGTPNYAIYNSGSTTTTATYNSHNFITNCNIYNFYTDGNISSAIFLTTATGENWTITGNSFYQSAARVSTNTSYYTAWNVIFIGTSAIVGLNISNNYFGGSAPNCGGEPWRLTNGAQPPVGSPSFLYVIRGGAGTTIPSTIQGNTIQNFRLNLDMTALNSAATIFSGILISGGDVNVGTVTGNLIGNNTDTGNVEINFFGTTTSQPYIRPIRHQASGNIENNIIGSYNMTGVATLTNGYIFAGIAREGTPLAPFTISNNIIGSTTVPNSILGDAYQHEMNGIYSSANTQPITINNNTIANMTSNGTLALSAATVYGIRSTGTSPPVITNNLVRNLIASNAANGNNMYGIYCYTSAAGQVVTYNTIYSLYSTNTSGTNTVGTVGIITGTSGSGTMSNNRVYDLRNQSTAAGSDIDAIVPQGGTWICSNNQLTLTNGELTDGSGMFFNTSQESVLFNYPVINSRNNNFSILNTSSRNINTEQVSENNRSETNTAPITTADINTNDRSNDIKQLEQINRTKKEAIEKFSRTKSIIQTPDNLNLQNSDNAEQNRSPVSRTHKESYTPDYTNDIILLGILDANNTGNWSYYYNSVYVGGSIDTGTQSSAAYVRVYTGTTTHRNNIYFNARTGGTANYAIANEASTPSTGWSSSASNYNLLVSSNASTIGEWGVGINRTIDEWRTSSGGDKQSWSTTSSSLNASNLFTSLSAGNLNIQTANVEAWVVSGKGIAVAGQNTDFGGVDTRSVLITTGVTDIGSDEFSALLTTPPLATESGAPAAGTTTNYTLWGRTLCSIEWGPNGTFPTGMYVRYYSGVNNPNVVGGNYQNGYWTVTPSGGSMSTNAKYNIIFNFGDNETYTISSPSTNTVLAKYESWGAWEVYANYVSGLTNWKTQRTWNTATSTYNVRVDSLQTFSDFALTDATAALPVVISEFSATVNKNNVNLKWVTEKEINNKEFVIQRAKIEESGRDFMSWESIATVAASGTTNQRRTYGYSDIKLNVGKYNYRLKQVDYNNNFEYFDLTNPKDVIVGKPMNSDISQNYPNPSNPKSKIDYQIPFKGKVSIKIYEVTGREVLTLVDAQLEAGYYTTEFNGTNLASGVYFYRIIAEGEGQKFVKTLKMILVK